MINTDAWSKAFINMRIKNYDILNDSYKDQYNTLNDSFKDQYNKLNDIIKQKDLRISELENEIQMMKEILGIDDL